MLKPTLLFCCLPVLAIVLVGVSCSARPAAAQPSPQWQLCTDKGQVEPDRRIAACTAVIESGRETKHDQAVAFTTRGTAYYRKRDLDRAIADYSEAIRLDPNYALPFANRGRMYVAKGDRARGIPDFTEAIRLDPKDGHFFSDRGNAYYGTGERDRAIADYNEAIRLDPKLVLPFWNRGVADLDAGALAQAVADFSRASELDPKDAYAALWLEIANKRSKLPSRLALQIAQLDMTNWPAPVVRLYLGQMTPQAALAAAADADAATEKGQTCEANFYSGELALLQGAKDEATRLFRLAVSGCPRHYVEFVVANTELKTLGVTP